MTIDPRIGMWISIIAAVLMFTAGATTELTNIFNAIVATKVTAIATFLGGIISAINAVLHAIPSISGPAGDKQFPLGPKA